MSPKDPGKPSSPDADAAFDEFLRRRDLGEQVDFETFCAERPEMSKALRMLHSVHLDAQRHARADERPVKSQTPSRGALTSFCERFNSERPPLTPTQIGPYRILEPIGAGGMGTVFVAEQEHPIRRRVALKVIKLGMDTREVVVRFEAERQALAVMDHTNVARVYDAGTTESGRPYFVMEWVRGAPLAEYCDRHKLTIKERLELFTQVCQGVEHAHRRGIIHRDLKPGNILVSAQDEKPVAKIIDFGVARATNHRLTEKTIYTEIGKVVGTLDYMSPEQAQMTSEDIDSRTDIYSLGVILYELLVGELPMEFLAKAAFDEILRRVREEQPPTPSTRWSRLSVERMSVLSTRRSMTPIALGRTLHGDLDWIVMKAIDKDRIRRYATAREMAEDIRCYLGQEPVKARPPSTLYRVRKTIIRHKWGFAGAGLVFICLVVIVVAALTYARQQRDLAIERAAFASERDKARQEVEEDLYRTLIGRAAALRTARTPGYRREVFEHLRQAAALHVRDKNDKDIRDEVVASLGDPIGLEPLDSPDVERLSQPVLSDRFAAVIRKQALGWSRVAPHEEWMAVYWTHPSRKVVLFNTVGDAVAETVPPRHLVYVLAFSPDGKRLAAGCNSGITVWRIPDMEMEMSFGGSAVYDLAMHPNGGQLATFDQTQHIEVWSLASHRLVASFKAPNSVRKVEFNADGSLLLGLSSDRKKVVTAWPINRTPEKLFLIGHKAGVPRVAFSPRAAILASASKDNTVRIWNVTSGRLLRTIKGHRQEVQCIAFSPDGSLLVSGSWDATIAISDMATGLRQTFKPDVGYVWDVEFDSSGHLLVVGGSKGVTFWKLHRRPSKEVFLSHARTIQLSGVVDIAVHPDGSAVAARNGPTLVYCDLNNEWAPRTIEEGLRLHYTLHFDRAGTRLFFATRNSAVGTWDCHKGILAATTESRIVPHNHAYTLDNRWLATNAERRLCIFDMTSDRQVLVLPPEPEQPAGTAWSSDGRFLAAGLTDGRIVIWDLDQLREQLREFGTETHSTRVKGVQDVSAQATAPRWLERVRPGRTDRDLVDRARLAIARREWDEAVAVYSKLLRRKPAETGWDTPRIALCNEIASSNEAFDRLSKLLPGDGDLWIGRGRHFLDLGRWKDAHAAYARAVEHVPPVSGAENFLYACLEQLEGDEGGYKRFFARMMEEFSSDIPSSAYSLARTAGIAPDPPVDVRRIVEWAEFAVARKDNAWHRHALALAYYRSSSFDRAVKTAQESNQRAWHAPAKSLNWFILAMATHRQGNTEQAQSFLKKARSLVNARDAVRRAALLRFPTDLVAFELLHREAESLISSGER